MQQHSFITLTGCDENNHPVATHVPVIPEFQDGKIFLYGHVMKESDHRRAFEKNPEVLAVFSGPHCYVSASWYSNQLQASTWNYMAVHAKGYLKFLDEDALYIILRRLTTQYEKNDESPSLVEKLPREYVKRLIKAIVGFKVEISEVNNVFKLSQNHNQQTYSNIIEKLEQTDDAGRQIAEEMKKRKAELFHQVKE